MLDAVHRPPKDWLSGQAGHFGIIGDSLGGTFFGG